MILLLKLNDGTEIITDAEESAEHPVYHCINTLQIITRQDSEGSMSMGLAPFMPYVEQDSAILIPTGMAIVAMPGKDITEHYNKVFSKIILPESKKIII